MRVSSPVTFSLALLGCLFIFCSQRAPYFVSFDLILTRSQCLLSIWFHQVGQIAGTGTGSCYGKCCYNMLFFRFKSIIQIYPISSDLNGLTAPNHFHLSNLESNG